ncbi:transposable element Tcb2 transposase [Trichonephila clavipes]|uniref:Transposable element Tcb2 transposase n=1 Tax=Trichonephila clavipes TaxID=2585209 RepID=A0A8X7BDE3_TRICX|nr:transposable element Tcb2 transposase [Trichonephila clavipes]
MAAGDGGISGSDMHIESPAADSLAKSAAADTCLTFAELSSIKRIQLKALWRIPPAHLWYFGNKPCWCHQFNIPRDQQLVATSNLLLFNRAEKSSQSVIGATVLFTDESRFSLITDSRCTFIWREPETRYLLSYVREIDNYGGGGLIVWEGIMLDGRTPLRV